MSAGKAISGGFFGCFGVLGAVVLCVVLLAMCGRAADSPADQGPTWSPPAGFTAYNATGGQRVGIEWSEATRAECRSGVACFAVNVLAENGCPRNLYVSVTLLDDAGNNIGWTNDTAQGVQAGENTRLVFTTYEREAMTARVADVSCY